MSRAREVELLRRRARSFLARALESFNAGDYDLAVFLAEQAVQLHLKAMLLEKVGDYPKVHSIMALASILGRLPECRELVSFLEENRVKVGLLEDAYIASRYLAREYSREEAEILVNFAREVLEHGGVC
ncbi:MAG: HEPN domain-containing protein [Thermofilum sp.]